ncbi:MAG: GTP-binding protein [Candidatus Obscuribacter sp.]|nr:GTP-binding protein [Candidatus Obscuribacter sp.]
MDEIKRKVPVTVLTGFLGSGKTTLLNRILSENHGKRIAVVENEFGEIGIDNALVVNAEEEIFEMNNGCICCTVRGDLIRILGNLMKRRDKFDYILVETTGLADPAPVAQTFFVDDEVQDALELDGIVTLVDAKHVLMHLDSSSECKEQVAFADVILLNKTDLVTEDELDRLETRIRSMNAMAKIHRSKDAVVDMEKILNVRGFDLERALTVKPTFLQPEYPFEWAGIYEVKGEPLEITLAEGPDPSMDILVLESDSTEAKNIELLLDEAVRSFSSEKEKLQTRQTIAKPGQLYQLNLEQNGSTAFTIKLSKIGSYVLFTQHKPEEFNMAVNSPSGTIVPTAANKYEALHTHDSEVSSVGISSPGDLDEKKFNNWLGKLLKEKGTDIFRMKGILSVFGQEKRFVFQGVHMLFDGKPDKPWGAEPRSNQLVFIGRNLNRAELTEGFNECLKKNHQLSLR